MRARGVAYDTGFIYKGSVSRERFDAEVVARELTIIRDDLHCTAVQVVGGDPERLEVAAQAAADLGLEVWFSPYPLELTPEEMLTLFADCAERAERVRRSGAEVVFVTGVELSLMNRGFATGESVQERLGRLLGDPDRRSERLGEISARVNDFLSAAVPVVRDHFRGRLTYAAIPFERVDWARFDIVSLELIRTPEVADQYRAGIHALVGDGKPIAITGFGSAAYEGASEKGARAMEVIEYDDVTGAPIRLDRDYVRDEESQATDLREVLEILDTEGVDSAFVYLFALESLPHRPDGEPSQDLDMASPAIVKTLERRRGVSYPDMEWEPKAAFHAVAECYGA